MSHAWQPPQSPARTYTTGQTVAAAGCGCTALLGLAIAAVIILGMIVTPPSPPDDDVEVAEEAAEDEGQEEEDEDEGDEDQGESSEQEPDQTIAQELDQAVQDHWAELEEMDDSLAPGEWGPHGWGADVTTTFTHEGDGLIVIRTSSTMAPPDIHGLALSLGCDEVDGVTAVEVRGENYSESALLGPETCEERGG